MLYIILASVLYTLGIIFATAASRNTNTNLAGGIMNSIAALIPIVLVIPVFTKKLLVDSKYGILMAVLAGLALALFTIFLTKSYSVNKVAIVSPIVFGGAIFLSAILSFLFFKEKIDLIQGIGLALLGLGLILIIYSRAVVK